MTYYQVTIREKDSAELLLSEECSDNEVQSYSEKAKAYRDHLKKDVLMNLSPREKTYEFLYEPPT